jgi:hypothetical protein
MYTALKTLLEAGNFPGKILVDEPGGNMRRIITLLALLVASVVACAQSETRPEILVLGTYHMANPGRDIFNMQADDVLSPKRQQEIAQVVKVLKKFQPTKIAVEANVGSTKTTQNYANYLAGKYTLTRNEDEQIGFRLAKEVGLKTIYPVDEDGDFPYGHVINYAKAKSQASKLDALQATTGARIKDQDDFLHSHTVLEMLELMNSDSTVTKDVASYFAFVPYGDPDDYAGPDLLARWYQRNIRIYHNIVALIDSPSDKILVIYGAGHLGWLQQDASNDATVKLRKLGEFTKQ